MAKTGGRLLRPTSLMGLGKLPHLSVVIPVYNSQDSLRILIERLSRVLPMCAELYEVVLVNDGSHDRSWDVIGLLAQEYPWTRGINLLRNYGQHNALLCGIRAAKGDVAITMDDDLQHPPEEIPKLLEKLGEGWDVVYGIPAEERHNVWRVLASSVTKLVLQHAMGVDIARRVSAFRAFRTQVRDAFSGFQGPYVSIDVLLTWGTTRFVVLPVCHDPRYVGASHYTVSKLMAHALNMMTGFSALPLRLASLMGFAFTLFGVGILIYVLGRYIVEGGSVPGFPFLASIIVIFSGAQLFALGIIGEYLARMYFRMMDRPTYTVRSITSGW